MRSPDDSQNLDRFAAGYEPGSGPDSAVIELDRWWIEANLRGPRILELGASDGTSTQLLLTKARELDVVEGASRYCELIRRRVTDARVTVIEALFEQFEPTSHYDDIVLARALDYVAEPQVLLKRIRRWLLPEGRLHVVVQNAASLHRRLGVALGHLPDLTSLNESSVAMGHRRVYTSDQLLAECVSAGFVIAHVEGFFLKPFDYETLNRADSDLATELIPALYEIGREVSDDLCSQLYVMCRP